MPGLALRIVVLALGLGAVAPAVAAAQTIGYTFTKIAETTGVGPYVEFFSPVVIDDGRVFFVAETSLGERVILSGAGGALTTVIDSSLPGLTFFEDSIWDVNNAGTVAFIGTVNGETNAFTTALAGLTAINDPTDPNGVSGVAGFAIGNSGNVVVSVLTRMSLGNGGPLSLLQDAANDPSLPSLYAFLTINTNDVVAFIGHTATGFAVYKITSAGTLTTIGSLPETVGGAPQINDSGVVAFYRRTAASGPGTRAIVVGSGGSLLTVADNTTAFTEFGAPGINNSGTLAFLALTPGLPGIPVRIGAFTGPNPIGDRVLRTGDPLFGATVTGMLGATITDSLGRAGLNNSGQIAFLVVLADGRRVVVRANPGAAPNAPPVVTNPGDQMVTRGQAITPLRIQASDPDGGNVLTYQASGLPPGLTINTSTGVITGTPGPTSAGQWTTTLNVSDGRAGTLATFVWTVVATVPPTVQFDRTTYTVGEAAGNATITVTRTGSTTNAVTVQYATSPGTATEGVDLPAQWDPHDRGRSHQHDIHGADRGRRADRGARDAQPHPVQPEWGDAGRSQHCRAHDHRRCQWREPTVRRGDLHRAGATWAPGPEPRLRDHHGHARWPGHQPRDRGLRHQQRDRHRGHRLRRGVGDAHDPRQSANSYVRGLAVPRHARRRQRTNESRAGEPDRGAVLGTQSTAVLTITDNNVGGTLQLSAAAYSVSEAGGQATIKVNRTGGAASGVTVQYATSDGTAVAGTDYTTTTGTLTFGANEPTKTFTVPILDNVLADGNRKFTVGLTRQGVGACWGCRARARRR